MASVRALHDVLPAVDHVGNGNPLNGDPRFTSTTPRPSRRRGRGSGPTYASTPPRSSSSSERAEPGTEVERPGCRSAVWYRASASGADPIFAKTPIAPYLLENPRTQPVQPGQKSAGRTRNGWQHGWQSANVSPPVCSRPTDPLDGCIAGNSYANATLIAPSSQAPDPPLAQHGRQQVRADEGEAALPKIQRQDETGQAGRRSSATGSGHGGDRRESRRPRRQSPTGLRCRGAAPAIIEASDRLSLGQRANRDLSLAATHRRQAARARADLQPLGRIPASGICRRRRPAWQTNLTTPESKIPWARTLSRWGLRRSYRATMARERIPRERRRLRRSGKPTRNADMASGPG